MDSLLRRMVASPLLVRVAPFAVFVALTFFQGKFGEASRYWIYAAKTVAGAWSIWLVRPSIAEMRWTFSWESVVVGVAVFAMWVGIDGLYPSFDRLSSYVGLAGTWSEAELASVSWNPRGAFGPGSGLPTMFSVYRV